VATTVTDVAANFEVSVAGSATAILAAATAVSGAATPSAATASNKKALSPLQNDVQDLDEMLDARSPS
jgi:hypothetical protein